MEKLSDNNIKGICTVKELVIRLKLSRARFYQLQNRGVFPKPDRCGRSNRPFYTPDIRIGGAVRWDSQECAAWLTAGAPDRRTWEAMKNKN